MVKKSLLLFGVILLFTVTGCQVNLVSVDKIPWQKEGQVLFQDDFKDDSSGWEITRSPYELKGYSDSGYLISVNTVDSRSWSRPKLKFTDVQVEVITQKIIGPDDTDFGLICRYQDKDNFYAFLISSDGYYAIMMVQDGIETFLGSETFEYSEAIYQSDGANKVQATCLDDTLTLSTNGSELLSVKDLTFQAGDVGIILETRTGGAATVIYNDFIVTKK